MVDRRLFSLLGFYLFVYSFVFLSSTFFKNGSEIFRKEICSFVIKHHQFNNTELDNSQMYTAVFVLIRIQYFRKVCRNVILPQLHTSDLVLYCLSSLTVDSFAVHGMYGRNSRLSFPTCASKEEYIRVQILINSTTPITGTPTYDLKCPTPWLGTCRARVSTPPAMSLVPVTLVL